MTTLLAIERYLPPYRYDQDEVTGWVRAWLEEKGGASAARLLSVYQTAGVKRRASVVPIEEVFAPREAPFHLSTPAGDLDYRCGLFKSSPRAVRHRRDAYR